MNTPFLDKIKELKNKESRFFVPGHKGASKAIPFFKDLLPYDLTEIEGADNLQNPQEALLQSQENMAKVYGTAATLYSTGGSTSCIEAMMVLFLHQGDTVVMGRNCHVSAVRAMAFLDAAPTWVYPQNGVIVPKDADEALARSGAKVLYVTSPDYYGNICDIAELRLVCDKHHAKLIVDGAHGAHFILFDKHPMQLGADAVAESLHKTLPALTPAAQLHIKDGALQKHAKDMLNLFTSTSPSYPVLCSIDWCAGLLQEQEIKQWYQTASQRLQKVQQQVSHMVLIQQDSCKLTLVPGMSGYTAGEVAAALRENEIEPEMVTETHIVLMVTGYNTKQDFEKLTETLQRFPAQEKRELQEQQFPIPTKGCSIRKALFGEKEQIEIMQAAGRIAAEVIAPCPPGIPVLIPGDVVSEALAKSLRKSGILKLEVV